MKVGFTGTRLGMSRVQNTIFTGTLLMAKIGELPEFHHGDCIGADAQAHLIALKLGFIIHIHPPSNPKQRAFCTAHHDMTPKPYIERNHNIVDAVELMIATPDEAIEQLRSGTWATIRYAWKRNRKIIIIGPNGEML